jgi:hypothetical protein
MNSIPAQPSDLNFTNRRWPLIATGLYLLASQTTSVRYELETLLGKAFDKDPDSKLIRGIFRRELLREDLIYAKTFRIVWGYHRLSAVRLTERGKQVCRSFGWEPHESEWQRLIIRHSGDRQLQHTGAVMTFSLGARLRGWNVTLLPETNIPFFFPDLLIEKNGERMYVEVELGSRKKEKWQLYKRTQGFAALCAKTSASRDTLVCECNDEKLGGMATDLHYLVKNRDPQSPLWIDKWSG